VAFFEARFDLQGLFLSLLVLVVSLINFSAIGLISASFILVLKKGNPVSWIFSSVSELLGGVLYPVAVLPLTLQFVAKFLPITYSLRAMRAVLIQGKTFNSIFNDLLILSAMGLALLAVAFISFKVAIKKVKTDGTLTHF
jgi:ABC-2 type transport system permease protein